MHRMQKLILAIPCVLLAVVVLAQEPEGPRLPCSDLYGPVEQSPPNFGLVTETLAIPPWLSYFDVHNFELREIVTLDSRCAMVLVKGPEADEGEAVRGQER